MILSPAKTMDSAKALPKVLKGLEISAPAMLKETDILAQSLKKQSRTELGRTLNGVNASILSLNVERYKQFDIAEKGRPAIYVFNGPAYKGMAPYTDLDKKALEYGQQNLKILCGLYGYLRPLDGMQEYRLEMSNKFNITATKQDNLYDFWTDPLTDQIISEAKEAGISTLVNVASDEYSKALDFDRIKENKIRIVKCKFLTDGRQSAVYSKQARGLMVKYCMVNQLTEPDQLKDFALEGYKLLKQSSSKSLDGLAPELVFTRAKPKAVSKAKKRKASSK